MEIEEKLMNIFEKFNINLKNDKTLEDKSLLGKEIQLKARDLLIILYIVEAEFSITIPKEDIISGKFDSYYNILQIIKNTLIKERREVYEEMG